MNLRRSLFVVGAVGVSALGTGCSAPDASAESSQAAVVEAPDAAAPAGVHQAKEIHWFRSSAEYRAITRQTYALAEGSLASRTDPWAIVLDVDETVLDNSEYQKENQGKPFSQDAWTAWVNRKEAKAVPGAPGFTQHVHALGGKVVLVTNRLDGAECPATEVNLKAVGVTYDAILCKKDTSDKNPRFKAIAAGTAVAGLPAMEIVAFVGDNIQDFPDQSQALASADEGAFKDFGARFFVLPNPMYGSWEANPEN